MQKKSGYITLEWIYVLFISIDNMIFLQTTQKKVVGWPFI